MFVIGKCFSLLRILPSICALDNNDELFVAHANAIDFLLVLNSNASYVIATDLP